jgi:hypothetical protein
MTIKEADQTKFSSILGGWVQAEGEPEGVFTTAQQPQNFTTPEFSQFAQASRSRWDLVEFFKAKIQQHKEKESSDKIG